MTNAPDQQPHSPGESSGLVTIALKDSSNLAGAKYDPATGELHVEFRNGGKYSYGGFTAELAKAWADAKSAGGWFDANVKKQQLKHPLLDKAPSASAPAAPADVTERAPAPIVPALAVDANFVHADVLEMAETLYRAYIKNSDGKAWDGRPCPEWDGLGRPVRSHWCAAATAALVAVAGVGPGEVAALTTQVAHLKRTADQAEARAQSRLESEVMARTAMLDGEVTGLRAQLAKLESEKRKFAPWRKD